MFMLKEASKNLALMTILSYFSNAMIIVINEKTQFIGSRTKTFLVTIMQVEQC